MPAPEWRSSRPGRAELKKGLHLLTCYHSELRGSQRVQAGWKPPGAERIRLIPPSAFADALPATVTAFEERTEKGIVQRLCFAERTVGRKLVNRRVHARLVQLRAIFPAGKGASFRWTSAGRTVVGAEARFWAEMSATTILAGVRAPRSWIAM